MNSSPGNDTRAKHQRCPSLVPYNGTPIQLLYPCHAPLPPGVNHGISWASRDSYCHTDSLTSALPASAPYWQSNCVLNFSQMYGVLVAQVRVPESLSREALGSMGNTAKPLGVIHDIWEASDASSREGQVEPPPTAVMSMGMGSSCSVRSAVGWVGCTGSLWLGSGRSPHGFCTATVA